MVIICLVNRWRVLFVCLCVSASLSAKVTAAL